MSIIIYKYNNGFLSKNIFILKSLSLSYFLDMEMML